MTPGDDVIVVLDYANGTVHKFHYEGAAEVAYEKWLAEHRARDGDCNWMATTDMLVHL